MKKFITEEEIYEIETEKQVGEYLVKRVNMTDLEVIHQGSIVFKGEDFEVADFINEA